jgi:adenylate cyclase
MSLAGNLNTTRRLAAILAADVVGYSRLMGADEEGTLTRLKAHRRELIDPKIAEHRGRIVKTTGDGVLVEFASVVDAVRCAVEVQRAMAGRETDLPQDRRIRFRIGINLGDIIADGGDIFGDGVNVAARLEGLAEPGGVCVARTVRNQVRDKLPYDFADMGEQAVKNIARPVRADALSAAAVAATPLIPVRAQPGTISGRNGPRPATIAACLLVMFAAGIGVWWAWPRGGPVPAVSPPPVAGAPAKPAPRLSMVVLPFANLSNDPEQEYFVDAITDDLTTDLSRIVNSFVIARTTAFTYKGKPIDVKQIGRDLGVRYVLEGSVRRLGEQVQINVQLVETETGAHVWADRFNTDRANLARAQNEITGRLAQTLRLQLLEAVGRSIDLDKATNLDARDLVMRGWALYYRPTSKVNLHEAQQAFDRALELDPESVEARVGLGAVLGEYLATLTSNSRERDMERGEQVLREALERDRNHPQGHAELGRILRIKGALAESKIELERAVSLDRNNAKAILQLGITLLYLAQPDMAIPYFQSYLQLSPRHQNIFFPYLWLGHAHMLLQQPDQAIDYLASARSANPNWPWSYLQLTAAFGLKGDVEEAKRAYGEWLKRKPDLNSIAKIRSLESSLPYMTPEYRSLRDKSFYVGYRRAGIPEE